MPKRLSDKMIRELEGLCDQGKRIHAAKRYIELTGCSLEEAKNWIDQYETKEDDVGQAALTDMTDSEARRLLMQGNKIQAIKEYRQATGCSLKEAKSAMESVGRANHEQDDAIASPEATDPVVVEQKGCLGLMVLLTLFAILFYSLTV